MKKRQVMALILAAALALPNTSVVADIVGVPVVAEAAASSANVNVKANSTVAKDADRKDVMAALQTLFANPIILPVAEAPYASDKLTLGTVDGVGEWSLQDGNTNLKNGDANLTLRFTFNEGIKEGDDLGDLSGSGWDQLDNGQYYSDFKVTLKVVKTVSYDDIKASIKWPELGEKTFDETKKSHGALWSEDVNGKSDANGTFSIDETTADVEGKVDNTVKVKYTLKSGYVFSGAVNDTTNKVAGTAGEPVCVKTYSNVKVSKKVISLNEITWPEIDATKIAFDGTIKGTALSGGDDKDGKIEFSLVKDNQGTAFNTEKFVFGANSYAVKAALSTAAQKNYIFEGKTASTDAVYTAKSVKVETPKMTGVTIKKREEGAAAGTATTVDGDIKLGNSPEKGTTLSAAAVWENNSAEADKIYDYTYQWFKDGKAVTEATSSSDYLLDKEGRVAGEYKCEVTAKIKPGTTLGDADKWAKEQTKSANVNVVVTDIAVTAPANGVYNSTTYPDAGVEFDKLVDDVKYTFTIAGVDENANVKLVMKDADGKTVTSDKISGEVKGNTATAVKNGTLTYDVTVNRKANAGTYNFFFEITSEGKTVTLSGNKGCVVKKQVLDVVAAKINVSDVKHGDSFDSLKVTYGDTPLTDDQKKIIEKVDIAVASDRKPATASEAFTGDYFNYAQDGNKVVVSAKLKAAYEKDYKITGTGMSALTPADDAQQIVEKAVTVGQKDVTLTVNNGTVSMIAGQALPELKVTGFEECKEKGFTGEVDGYTLVKKSDPSQKDIKNAIKKQAPGEYILKISSITASNANGDESNYNFTPANANLTIYESEHTVGFVTYGDTNIADAKVYHGQAIGTLPTPTRAGYKFIGWYSDRNCTTAYDAKAPVTSNIVLYAKWEKVSGTNGGQNSADAVKAGTTTKTSAGTFAVINASTRTVAYKAASKSAKKVTVPSSVTIKGVSYKVTKIDNNAFKNCKKLTKVSIPSTVTEIGTAAFKGCKKLTSVTIPKNVNKIGKEAFSGCSKLKKVTIKSTKIKSVGKNAFKGIAKKSAIKTPKSKKAAYKKILKKSGYKKTVK